MRSIREFPLARAAEIEIVFTDIDDTLTTEGRLEAVAFSTLWKLHAHGVAVVPVTGRPAGWCDAIARMWPVAGIVGENGALFFRYDAKRRRVVRRFVSSAKVRAANRSRLDTLEREILKAVPRARVASDQAYRLYDLAIDFCEDVPRLSDSEINEIVRRFERAGATAKVSSIHVNGWFGRYDKLKMIKRFASEVFGLDLEVRRDNLRCAYVGDSPNDEPAFGFFENSVGVANVKDFAARLETPPRYITPHRSGRGFQQIARRILGARTSDRRQHD